MISDQNCETELHCDACAEGFEKILLPKQNDNKQKQVKENK